MGGTLGTDAALYGLHPGAGRDGKHLIMKNKKLVINANEISTMLGVGIRQAQRYRQRILDERGKKRHQVVTYEEFAEYAGLDIELVLQACFGR